MFKKNIKITIFLLYFPQIKTTCPHRYVVKPHRGEIPASSNMEIDVTLLPFHFRETEKYNDKFLLQVRKNGLYVLK